MSRKPRKGKWKWEDFSSVTALVFQRESLLGEAGRLGCLQSAGRPGRDHVNIQLDRDGTVRVIYRAFDLGNVVTETFTVRRSAAFRRKVQAAEKRVMRERAAALRGEYTARRTFTATAKVPDRKPRRSAG